MSYNSAISIHALREEGDARTRAIMCLTFTFLSTPSARRATTAYQRQTCSDTDFYPRPPRGGRPFVSLVDKAANKFLSTPSARRATSRARLFDGREDISIHALREEGDNSFQCSQSSRLDFYPRPPRGGRLRLPWCRCSVADFYPRPPRGGRLTSALPSPQKAGISIHALREEGDRKRHWTVGTDPDFYPRPPRGGRLHLDFRCFCFFSDFYPRPPRGGRPLPVFPEDSVWCISIHALREEGDSFFALSATGNAAFLSTPSARRATPTIQRSGCVASISIHALREEGDVGAAIARHGVTQFLSTPSARRATASVGFAVAVSRFLSTPSARRATFNAPVVITSGYNFYPRPPRGGRPGQHGGAECDHNISIHALREEGDLANIGEQAILNKISIHALREEGDCSAW